MRGWSLSFRPGIEGGPQRSGGGKGPAGAAVTTVYFKGKGCEETAVAGDDVEIDQAFHDGDPSTEQNTMNPDELLGVRDIGDGRWLHAKDLYSVFDAPVSKVGADPGELLFIKCFAELPAPVCVEEKMIARGKGLRQGAEMSDGEDFPGGGIGQADNVGGSQAGLEGSLIDEGFATVEVPGRIHVGPAVGVKVIDAGVPSVPGGCLERLQGNPWEVLGDSARQVDQHYGA